MQQTRISVIPPVMQAETLLPERILKQAVRSGQELGWRAEALPEVLTAAQAMGLGVLGGQVQFVLPDGTCELYWQSFDPAERADGEPWLEFVARSHREAAAAVGALPSPAGLVRDGVEQFDFLRQRAAEGIDLKEYLCYIVYFEAEG